MISGAHFMYTFGEATGTYEFGDPNYPNMKGAIIVKKGQTLWVATNLHLPEVHLFFLVWLLYDQAFLISNRVTIS